MQNKKKICDEKSEKKKFLSGVNFSIMATENEVIDNFVFAES